MATSTAKPGFCSLPAGLSPTMSKSTDAAYFTLRFDAKPVAGKQRVDGHLTLGGPTGSSWTACSGSKTLLPLPRGLYHCSNYRVRTKAAMVAGGVGFSVDLEPQFSTTRTLLRIHPDGNLPGTEGCVGITDADVAGCAKELEKLLMLAKSRHVVVQLIVSY